MLEAADRHATARWRRVAAALLVTAALESAGLALWAQAGETPIFEVLVFDWHWPQAAVAVIETVAGILHALFAAVLLAAALAALVDRLPLAAWWLAPLAAWVSLWQLLLATGAWLRGENFRPLTSWGWLEDWLGNWQVWAEDAVRFAAPLALLLWLAVVTRSAASAWTGRVIWLLRVAAATTFAVHGYEALRGNARFVDLLLAFDQKLLSGQLSEHAARRILLPIGWIDLALASLILLCRSRAAAGYMAVWGGLTALSRMMHSGWEGGWESLIRAANCGVPLAICLYWSRLPPPAREVPPDVD